MKCPKSMAISSCGPGKWHKNLCRPMKLNHCGPTLGMTSIHGKHDANNVVLMLVPKYRNTLRTIDLTPSTSAILIQNVAIDMRTKKKSQNSKRSKITFFSSNREHITHKNATYWKNKLHVTTVGPSMMVWMQSIGSVRTNWHFVARKWMYKHGTKPQTLRFQHISG